MKNESVMDAMMRKRRDELGLTNGEIAQQMYYCKNTIEGWMRGKYMPKTCDIPRLCEVLQCTPSFLFGWEEIR